MGIEVAFIVWIVSWLDSDIGLPLWLMALLSMIGVVAEQGRRCLCSAGVWWGSGPVPVGQYDENHGSTCRNGLVHVMRAMFFQRIPIRLMSFCGMVISLPNVFCCWLLLTPWPSGPAPSEAVTMSCTPLGIFLSYPRIHGLRQYT